jgi:FkbM family methyltransferase
MATFDLKVSPALPAAVLLIAAAAFLELGEFRCSDNVIPVARPLSPPSSNAASDAGFRFMSTSQLGVSGTGAATFTVPSWVWHTKAEAEAAAAAPPTAAEAAATAAALADRTNYKAQDGEDRFALDLFFSGVRGGLILESGALDGVLLSTSWLFERALGWRAIHVEASASNYAHLVRNRPGALNIHAALCKEPASLHMVAQNASSPTAVGGIWEFMAPRFREYFWPGISDVSSLPTVACLPLAPLLALFGITHVDFWVLDVEGAELEVLRATDFSKVSFGVIVIETDGHVPAKDREVVELLESNGYVSYGLVERNTWLVSRDIVLRGQLRGADRS